MVNYGDLTIGTSYPAVADVGGITAGVLANKWYLVISTSITTGDGSYPFYTNKPNGTYIRLATKKPTIRGENNDTITHTALRTSYSTHTQKTQCKVDLDCRIMKDNATSILLDYINVSANLESWRALAASLYAFCIISEGSNIYCRPFKDSNNNYNEYLKCLIRSYEDQSEGSQVYRFRLNLEECEN